MAWFRRHPGPGLIFHSDRGSQYCSHSFQATLASYGMLSSMSRKGNCWVAPTESLWGSLKVGRLYGQKFATQREATPMTNVGTLLARTARTMYLVGLGRSQATVDGSGSSSMSSCAIAAALRLVTGAG